MKKTITSIIITIIYISVCAQTPNWEWAKSAGGSSNEQANNIAVDKYGNSYITGSFSSSPINFGSVNLTNNGGGDFFIAKYDHMGNIIWANSAGGTGGDAGLRIAVDLNGNAYVTGIFSSPSITFGSIILTNNIGNSQDIFIARYDNMGNVVWAKSAGGTGYDLASSIAVDVSGNSYLTGYFQSDSITFGNTSLANSGALFGNKKCFIVKYDNFGNAIWVKSDSFTGTAGSSIVVDKNGNVYIMGNYSGFSVTFDSDTISKPFGGYQNFFMKLDALGNVLNLKNGGENDHNSNIALDSLGNLFLSGYFGGSTLTFGNIVLVHNTFTSYADIFIVKYDSLFNVIWAKNAGGNHEDRANSIAVDANGNSYITGYFSSPSIVFGSTTLSLTFSNSYPDIFVVKYDSNGTVLWANSIGEYYHDEGQSLALDVYSNPYVTGIFQDSIAFGSTILTNTNGWVAWDIFVAKLGNIGVGIHENNSLNSIAIFPNPTEGIFTIRQKNSTKSEIEIHNIVGEIIYEVNFTDQLTVIDLSKEAKGIYFVKVFDGQKSYCKKLIIE